MPEPTVTPELWPAGLSATLHLTDHRHVACYDLPGEAVSLVLGDRDANVTMVGSIDHFTAIATAILDQLAAVANARKQAGQ